MGAGTARGGPQVAAVATCNEWAAESLTVSLQQFAASLNVLVPIRDCTGNRPRKKKHRKITQTKMWKLKKWKTEEYSPTKTETNTRCIVQTRYQILRHHENDILS